jgi:hypothetical protein
VFAQVRFGAHTGLEAGIARCPKSAPETEVAAAAAASFRKACFAETLNIQLRTPLTAVINPIRGAFNPIRDAKIGFKLKQAGYRFPRFCFAPKMSQGCREAEINPRRIMVLADGFFGRHDSLIETTKTDERKAHSCKR